MAAVTASHEASPPSHSPTHLPQAQPELVAVEKELGLTEPLRSELFCIAAIVQAVVPGGGHAVEQAVCMIKAAALQLPAQAREWLHAYEVEQGGACRAQVAAVGLPGQAHYSCQSENHCHDFTIGENSLRLQGFKVFVSATVQHGSMCSSGDGIWHIVLGLQQGQKVGAGEGASWPGRADGANMQGTAGHALLSRNSLV